MGLKSFFDNIIPNELKGNLGKIAGVAAAGYLGYKYAPSIYSSAKNFIGSAGMHFMEKVVKEILLLLLVC
jgi:hypothetical protein